MPLQPKPAEPSIRQAGLLFTVLLPHIDPRGDNIRRSGPAYGTMLIAGTVWFGLFHAFIVAHALGFKINDLDAMGIFIDVFGALLIITGNVFGKLRWNFTLGIRTPWTLADERVWDKTHRFAGWLFVINGFIVLATALTPLSVIVRLGITFVLLAATFVLTVGQSGKAALRTRTEFEARRECHLPPHRRKFGPTC